MTVRVRFACSSCGAATSRWEGRCPSCGDWNTLVEEAERPRAVRAAVPAGRPQPLPAVAAAGQRRPTGIGEVDRVLGGGVVEGGLVLLGGDPGIGKSTLALQIAARSGSADGPALYCAGEESAAQVGMRAARIGCASAAVDAVTETDLDVLAATLSERRPRLAVVDSVQTVHDPAVPGFPGSPSQVRGAVARLLEVAKGTGVSILLIGHVTKEGAIAGPRTLEHMVDVVLYLEGERHGEHRLLRGLKNRFGPAGELGLFAMAEEGMREVAAPGRAFLDESSLGVPGTALTVMCEGSRPLAVEVQALTAGSSAGLPRRAASGFDPARLHLLLAVLERRAGLSLQQRDVYVNAVGGVRVAEPAADLAVALALAGSCVDRPLPEGAVLLGEVGLAGEIRRVPRLEARLAEAAALGLERAAVPAGQEPRPPSGIDVIPVASLAEAISRLL